MTKTNEQLKVLMSEGSSTSARQTLYGLGNRYVTDIVDPTPWCQCRFSRFVRRWHRCPPVGRDPIGYFKAVVNRLRSEHYDVLLATHEQVYLASKYRELLEPHVGMAVPPFESLSQMQGKGDFTRLLERLRLPSPPTQIVRSEQQLRATIPFPCYVKLAHSTASYGVSFVRNEDELNHAISQFKRDQLWQEGAEVLMQQRATGIQSSLNAVFQNGRLIAAHCTETLATGIGGGSNARISASHPVVLQHAKQLGQDLNWHGPLLIEYFYDHATQQPEYIEANPRIGETVNAKLCGVDLVDLVVQISRGHQVAEAAVGRVGVKSYAGFLILLADAYNGATRRDLLRRLWGLATNGKEYGSENEMTRPREDWGSLIPAIATTLRLLAFPRSARRLSKNTVDNYALPQSAVSAIDQLSVDAMAAKLSQDSPSTPTSGHRD